MCISLHFFLHILISVLIGRRIDFVFQLNEVGFFLLLVELVHHVSVHVVVGAEGLLSSPDWWGGFEGTLLLFFFLDVVFLFLFFFHHFYLLVQNF